MRDCFQGRCLGVRHHIEKSSEQLQEQVHTGGPSLLTPRLPGNAGAWKGVRGCLLSAPHHPHPNIRLHFLFTRLPPCVSPLPKVVTVPFIFFFFR